MYLLDTNVISELRKAGDGRADPRVTTWLSQADAGDFYLSVVTLMELALGILLVARRDRKQGDRLSAWLETRVVREFAERTLPVDAAVARRCAKLHVPDPRPERDAFIAATALVHGMTVVTRNTGDFVVMGVPLLNPWEAS
ncbi:MAG: PIN domain-containing protein [Acidiferrobacter sp.]